MQRFKYVFLLMSCIAMLAILTTQSTGAEAATPKTRPPKATVEGTSVTSTLFGIAALSSNNVWAVGTTLTVPQFTGQPLITHWDGSKWQDVSSPATTQSAFSSLNGVTALSNNDAWAVGFSMNPAKLTGTPLIEHWDGSSWQIVSNSSLLNSGNLSAIAAIGPDNIWAVGSIYSTSPNGSKSLIEHWDGSSWQVIPGASITGNSNLLSVTAVSADNVWAVGSMAATKGTKTLIEHWNGTAWQIVPGPASSMHINTLSSVTALSDHDIWAVGSSFSQPLQVSPSLIHWDGSTWNKVSTTGLPASFAPNAIAALSANDIWVVGPETLAHWNGSVWKSMSGSSTTEIQILNSITALAQDNIWATGFSVKAKKSQPLIEHWNGTTWQATSILEPAVQHTPKPPLKH